MTPDLAQLRKLAEAATSGPWQVILTEHPHALGGKHEERWIFTTWDHPQAKGTLPVVTGSVGIAAEKGGKPQHMVSIMPYDAAYIAAANPAVILALLDRLEKAEGQR